MFARIRGALGHDPAGAGISIVGVGARSRRGRGGSGRGCMPDELRFGLREDEVLRLRGGL